MIGSLTLEQALTSRDHINAQLRAVLDEATSKWGIRVNRVEIKSIDPPGSIQEAMEKQMRAERDRRAAILTAEGVKQSQILTAEGQKQAAVLTAEGAKQAAILRAEGDAKAIATVFDAIHEGKPDPKLLSYQYLQMLPAAGQGRRQQGVRDPVRVRRGVRRHQQGVHQHRRERGRRRRRGEADQRARPGRQLGAGELGAGGGSDDGEQH